MYYYPLSYEEVIHLPWKVFTWLDSNLVDLVKEDTRGIH